MRDVTFSPVGTVIGPVCDEWSPRRKAAVILALTAVSWLAALSIFYITKGI